MLLGLEGVRPGPGRVDDAPGLVEGQLLWIGMDEPLPRVHQRAELREPARIGRPPGRVELAVVGRGVRVAELEQDVACAGQAEPLDQRLPQGAERVRVDDRDARVAEGGDAALRFTLSMLNELAAQKTLDYPTASVAVQRLAQLASRS